MCGGQKRETTTVFEAFNAGRTFSCTMVIFKGKRLKCEWFYGHPDSLMLLFGSLTMAWGQMFTEQLPRDDPRPHDLQLDSHSNRVYNWDYIQLMKATNAHVMAFRSHTKHALRTAKQSTLQKFTTQLV